MISRYSLPEMEKIWSEESKFEKWLAIELAVCAAWAELGRIPLAAVQRIKAKVRLDLNRIKEIEKTTRHDILAFVRAINETLGADSKFIHLGLTSSDVKDTALALQMRDAVDLIINDLGRLNKVLAAQAAEYKETIMVGRTHGVHAEPVTWGLKLAIWYQEVKRHLARMKGVRETINTGQFSGAVGSYASLDPRIEELVCCKLGLEPAVISNQILQRDRHADLLNNLALIAASLEKFTTEIRNLQRTDILEVEEGFRKGQQGSSAMPHKKNPIVCERISGLARVVRSYVIPGLENIALWHERDLTHSSVERIIIPDSTILVNYMINKFRLVLDELVINKDKMRDNLERTHGLVFSQHVMLALINKGLTREKAYQLAQCGALKAWDQALSYQEVIKGDPQINQYLSSEEIRNIFDYNIFLKELDYIYGKLGLSGKNGEEDA